MPVLPLVGSTIRVPRSTRPRASASSIMLRPIRSLTEPAGLNDSSLATTSARAPSTTWFSRTSGVPPISAVTSDAMRSSTERDAIGDLQREGRDRAMQRVASTSTRVSSFIARLLFRTGERGPGYPGPAGRGARRSVAAAAAGADLERLEERRVLRPLDHELPGRALL